MKNFKWPLQFIITLMLSTFIQDNIFKTVILLIFWLITFYPYKKIEVIFFIFTSSVFTISNYGALNNLTFDFTSKDIFLMPYNELFMWGFYCLNAHRFIGTNPSEIHHPKRILIYAFLFSFIFSFVNNEVLLTLIAAIILIIALIFFKSPRAFRYIIYFLFMGTVVESMGLSFNLWHYPHVNYFIIPLWAPFMWSNIGLIMSLMTTWIFNKKSIINNQTEPMQELIDDLNLPFAKRWQLLTDLDHINHRSGVYKKILKEWVRFYRLAGSPKKFSILEVGSGSGGLAMEIFTWAKQKNIEIDFHFIDSQMDSLIESQKRFSENKPHLHLDSNKHLEVFKNGEFDFVISLHVMHHIQPIQNTFKAIEEIARITSKGFLIFDFDQRPYSVLMARIFNFLLRNSKELSEDGIKSVKRAHSAIVLNRYFVEATCLKTYNWTIKPYILWPYWKLEAQCHGISKNTKETAS